MFSTPVESHALTHRTDLLMMKQKACYHNDLLYLYAAGHLNVASASCTIHKGKNIETRVVIIDS